jgi:L,D-transpeptidase ErfK/SrfK
MVGFSAMLPGLLVQPGLAVPMPNPSPNSSRESNPAAPALENYVTQSVLEAALPLKTLTVPNLPGLGNPDQFIPAQDAFAPLKLLLKLSERRVYIYQSNQVKTSFPVAIGRSGWETPTGKYEVIQMQHDPTWQHPFTGEVVPPGEGNPLGARWIGFWTDGTNYIGFHGTPNAETVGQRASHGCVRMYNQDVIQLFEMVKLGTVVEVVP